MTINKFLVIFLLCCSCSVGPKYSKPTISTIATSFREGGIDWKISTPNDQIDRGEWWKIFNDPILNELIEKLNINNQNIAVAQAQYQQSLALIDQARASYLPNINALASFMKQKQAENGQLNISNEKTINLNASWEIDLWGSIKQNIESNKANAQANKASLATIKLSSQSSLAQYYFELRTLDQDQKLLDKIVIAYQKTLNYTKDRQITGVANQLDILTAENNLQTAKVASINNNINRQQYQHAIAVLIGESPSTFIIPESKGAEELSLANIPTLLPSELLERRPDIAQSERLVAKANAQIGLAMTSYFPNLTLSGTIGPTNSNSNFDNLFSAAASLWSIGPQLATTIFDGGAISAQVEAAKANYQATIATYRQTVLSAMQDVEDNLVSLRILDQQAEIQNKITKNTNDAFKLAINQYKAGIIDYSALLNAEITLYNAEKNAVDTKGLKITATITLIKALGGGWEDSDIKFLYH